MHIERSTIQLLRFHFSVFLLPVFLFACSLVPNIDLPRAGLAFFILHFLVYPASNGYNSYMDRDESSIGGIKDPLQPTRQLFIFTVIMDLLAILLCLLISIYFAIGILAYILVSRAYSYRGIRLKKYPLAGYLSVVLFQGGVTFWLCYHACSSNLTLDVPLLPAIASSLLIGGSYPLTQIYQHEADRKDGVTTISYLLGYRGTFIFCGIVYGIAFLVLFIFFQQEGMINRFILFATMLSPVLFFFQKWARAVWHDISAADFSNTMKMNIVASGCTNLAFLALLIWNIIE
jgi:1,4-dihydroxy-2-naphthoate octaprenyltransferase